MNILAFFRVKPKKVPIEDYIIIKHIEDIEICFGLNDKFMRDKTLTTYNDHHRRYLRLQRQRYREDICYLINVIDVLK